MGYHQTDPFYLSWPWKRKRLEALAIDKGECQECKKRGKYTKATHVHHVFHRDKYPEYELDVFVTLPDGTVKRNLVSVCKDCHETVCHPERLRHFKVPITPERW